MALCSVDSTGAQTPVRTSSRRSTEITPAKKNLAFHQSVLATPSPSRSASRFTLNRTPSGLIRHSRSSSSLLRTSRSNLQELLRWTEGADEVVTRIRCDSEVAGGGLDIETMPSQECVSEVDKSSQPLWGLPPRALPVVLICSTLLGAFSMLTLQRVLMAELFADGGTRAFTMVWAFVYTITISCMAYGALGDPGQLSDEMAQQWRADEVALPKRAHKNWRVVRPILRFDHYCRWIGNCIGLRNHRIFMVMLAGFAFIALSGALVDIVLVHAYVLGYIRSETWATLAVLMLHFAYSFVFGWFAVPILYLHVGFVSRNELTHEWKRDEFYVVHDVAGAPVSVQHLDADEYNEHFDSFEYDRTMNPWDRGCPRNCFVFWCTPRCSPGQLGEF